MKRTFCPICGNVFEARDNHQKFCSPRCRLAAHRRMGRVREEMPEIHPTAFDLANEASKVWHVANELSALAAASPPEVAVVCSRLSSAVTAALDAEGL